MEKCMVIIYAALLERLPWSFRQAFGAEMRQVFAQRAHDSRRAGRARLAWVFLVELAALPGLWLLAYRRERRLGAMDRMQNETVQAGHETPGENPVQGADSWGAALAGALPLAAILLIMLFGDGVQGFLTGLGLGRLARFLWLDVLRISVMPMAFYLLLLGGLLAAWLKGFPRWSYSYLGWLLLFVISGMAVLPFLADPYLQARGETGLHDPYMRRIWAPLLLTLLAAVALRPSFRPLRALWDGWRGDWTRSLFAMLSLVEFLVIAGFDEMHGMLQHGWILAGGVLVVGALAYLRAGSQAGRLWALGGAVVGCVGLSVWITSYYYHVIAPDPVRVGASLGSMMMGNFLIWGIVIAIMSLPAVISAGLQRVRPRGAAG